jgi:thiol-disulfide isomerase/thioredoxin
MTFGTLTGDIIDLTESLGRKPIYLKMWATWCVPCREQMPHFMETFARIRDDFVVIAVSAGFSETESDVREYVGRMKMKMPVAIDDGRLAAELNLRVTPLHVVIGRNGRILHVGHLADERLERALVEAQTQSDAPVAARTVEPGPRPALEHLSKQILPLIDGGEIAVGGAERNEPTVLVFLSPWCEDYLAQSQPARSASCREVREAVEQLQTTSGATWIGIASGLWTERTDALAYRDAYKVTLPIVLDETGDLFRSFGVTAVPSIQVFRQDGQRAANIRDVATEVDWRARLLEAMQTPGDF